LQNEFKEAEQRLIKLNILKNTLYDDFNDGMLDEKEYNFTRGKYEKESNNYSERLIEISAELKKYSKKFTGNTKYADEMQRFKYANELSRDMLTALVENITVYSNKKIEIIFNYQDELEDLRLYIKETEATV
jgi:hypothetical protein